MPIYEYQCDACGRQTEVLQKISDSPLTDCPACGQPSLRKLVSRAGFQLKGTGWYVTDFRNGQKPAPRSEDKAESAATAGQTAPATSGDTPEGASGAAATAADKPATTSPTATAKNEPG